MITTSYSDGVGTLSSEELSVIVIDRSFADDIIIVEPPGKKRSEPCWTVMSLHPIS
jgi:hypothetical protein